jgi:hypothetical protein
MNKVRRLLDHFEMPPIDHGLIGFSTAINQLPSNEHQGTGSWQL